MVHPLVSERVVPQPQSEAAVESAEPELGVATTETQGRICDRAVTGRAFFQHAAGPRVQT